jgi:hypothetical protein
MVAVTNPTIVFVVVVINFMKNVPGPTTLSTRSAITLRKKVKKLLKFQHAQNKKGDVQISNKILRDVKKIARADSYGPIIGWETPGNLRRVPAKTIGPIPQKLVLGRFPQPH